MDPITRGLGDGADLAVIDKAFDRLTSAQDEAYLEQLSQAMDTLAQRLSSGEDPKEVVKTLNSLVEGDEGHWNTDDEEEVKVCGKRAFRKSPDKKNEEKRGTRAIKKSNKKADKNTYKYLSDQEAADTEAQEDEAADADERRWGIQQVLGIDRATGRRVCRKEKFGKWPERKVKTKEQREKKANKRARQNAANKGSDEEAFEQARLLNNADNNRYWFKLRGFQLVEMMLLPVAFMMFFGTVGHMLMQAALAG